jgi:hypothetical protein
MEHTFSGFLIFLNIVLLTSVVLYYSSTLIDSIISMFFKSPPPSNSIMRRSRVKKIIWLQTIKFENQELTPNVTLFIKENSDCKHPREALKRCLLNDVEFCNEIICELRENHRFRFNINGWNYKLSWKERYNSSKK